MARARNLSDWLSWLIRVRFLVILFLVGIELVQAKETIPVAVPLRAFTTTIATTRNLTSFQKRVSRKSQRLKSAKPDAVVVPRKSDIHIDIELKNIVILI